MYLCMDLYVYATHILVQLCFKHEHIWIMCLCCVLHFKCRVGWGGTPYALVYKYFIPPYVPAYPPSYLVRNEIMLGYAIPFFDASICNRFQMSWWNQRIWSPGISPLSARSEKSQRERLSASAFRTALFDVSFVFGLVLFKFEMVYVVPPPCVGCVTRAWVFTCHVADAHTHTSTWHIVMYSCMCCMLSVLYGQGRFIS